MGINRVPPARYRYLKQGVSVTGLGTPTFGRAVETAREIFERFERQFASGTLEGWDPVSHYGHSALNMTNRYLTPKKDAPDMEHIPFTKDVDPYGILENMAKSNYVHGEENDVLYYALETDENGKGR